MYVGPTQQRLDNEQKPGQEKVMAKTILVVDDKASMRRLVREYLTAEGFRVVTAENGREALFVARHEKPDLVLLDIMMPEMSGYEFMRVHTKERDTPIILLTAKEEESDRVLGFELGADDYVTKPFSMREVVARIRAVLRRFDKSAVPTGVLRAADVTLDKNTRRVRVGDRSVRLTPTEFDLLSVLMSAPGRVFSRLELLEEVQGVAAASLERSIDVHIRNLRTKIEPEPHHPRYVETVFGMGYRFCADSSAGGE
jgi:two-component system alkaline phosphatase synthesis response regulator PhoP